MHTRPPPIASYFVAIVCAVLFGCSLMVACNQSQRADTVHASVVAVTMARNAFTAWDRTHQMDLVAHATSRADAEQQIALYRVHQAEIQNGVEVAYRALALAATQTDDLSLQQALKAAGDLVDAIDKLRAGAPPPLPNAPPVAAHPTTTDGGT